MEHVICVDDMNSFDFLADHRVKMHGKAKWGGGSGTVFSTIKRGKVCSVVTEELWLIKLCSLLYSLLVYCLLKHMKRVHLIDSNQQLYCLGW